jgi:uncharacterized protein (TIGR00106 family)
MGRPQEADDAAPALARPQDSTHYSCRTMVRYSSLRSPMKATAEIQVIPIGTGVSVRREVQRAHELLVESSLKIELHAFGTNVEGELNDILKAIAHVHEVLHAEGVARLSTAVKIGTRMDKETTLAGKRF